MAKYNPKPRTSDGAIIFLTVCLMGAPEVLGPQLNHTLAVIMFWGGLSGLVLFLAGRWGAWVWRETFPGVLSEVAPEKPAGAEPESPDNRGGNFAGRDNTGIQQAFHGPVVINQALPAPHPPIEAPAKPLPIHKPPERAVRSEEQRTFARPSLKGARPTRDAKLREAIAYAVTGKWGATPIENSNEAKLMNTALDRFHQLAADGELTVWGKPLNGRVYQEVEPSYWVKHSVDFLSLFGDEAKMDYDTLPLPPYESLMVCRAEIERLWPSRKQKPDAALQELASKVVLLAHLSHRGDFSMPYAIALRLLNHSAHPVWIDPELQRARRVFSDMLGEVRGSGDEQAHQLMQESAEELSKKLMEKAAC